MRRSARLKICFIAATLILSGCGTKHPTDKDLIDRFIKNKADFNQLTQMFLADKGLTRVAPDFTRPDDPSKIGVTAERLKQYRKLFSKLSLSAGVDGGVDSTDEKDLVWFYASTNGLSISGSSKGYAYAVKQPELVVEDLDNYWSKDSKSFTAYRHIEGNWYLYFDFED